MARAKTKRANSAELDNVYLLKMVLYLVLGSFWLRIGSSSGAVQLPIPIGFIIGVALANRERLKIDKKLEYAIILVAMFIGFWLPIGLNLTF